MRQLLVQVPRGHGQEALAIAREHDGVNLALIEAEGRDESLDLVLIHVSNVRVETLLEELGRLPSLRVSTFFREVTVLKPPETEIPEQVSSLQDRSPIEIILAGQQSVGSWKGFLGYAVAAGVIVWVGMVTNSIFLLVGAMLVAPFAGPAMNAAIATAIGEPYLLGRSLLRYFASLATGAAVSALLTLLWGQRSPTTLMVSVSHISAWAVLLPLVAGSAGAINLIQSERSSLVSGAAVGLLVAAALAPQAGLIGAAAVMQMPQMVVVGAFQLLLQLVGINLAGALVFRLYGGLTSHGARYGKGTTGMSAVGLGVTLVALVALLAWQLTSPVMLRPATLAREVEANIVRIMDDNPQVEPVEINARFAQLIGQQRDTLLATVYVRPMAGTDVSAQELESDLVHRIAAYLSEKGYDVTPLVDVIVLETP